MENRIKNANFRYRIDPKIQTDTKKIIAMKRIFKIAILAVLAFACVESASADNKLESKDGNAQAKTVTQNEQQDPTEPSPEEREIYKKLEKMMFAGAQPNQINLKKDKEKGVLICHLRSITDPDKNENLGDAIIVRYLHPENKEEYFKLKKEGKNPDPTDFPTQETYLIPIGKGAMNLQGYKNNIDEQFGVERYCRIKSDVYCFKWEVYPEMFYELYDAGSSITNEDAARYFNYSNGGWVCWHNFTGDERCGLTKKIAVSYEDAKLIIDHLNKTYPNK